MYGPIYSAWIFRPLGSIRPSQQVGRGKGVRSRHRRRIKTDEKAKVVTVVWGTYLNAALTI